MGSQPSRSPQARPAHAAGTLVRPGPIWGPYPQRERADPPWRAAVLAWRVHRDRPRLLAALRRDPAPDGRPPLPLLQFRLRRDGYAPEVVADAMGHLGDLVDQHLGYRPHEAQVLAAWTMLQGCLVEMATGEGKTLATFLAAACAGLAGVPVHVLTANDYLAARDAAELRPMYEALGLSVGCVTAASTPEQRQAAYACEVTYAPARELAFDHLRDRVAHGSPDGRLVWQARSGSDAANDDRLRPGPLLRGLCLALIDEADSVLCDEARVPLILSGPGEQVLGEVELRTLLDRARALDPAVHAVVMPATGTGSASVRLTQAGRERLRGEDWAARRPWSDLRWREDWILRALTVLHALQRDRDYAVQDGAVVFIDPVNGRAAPERQWSRGLHQLLALKEDLPMPAPQQTLAQLTYQRLFGRYHQIGGTSGTLAEVRLEMALTYGTPVVRVPRHHPSRLADLGVQVCADAAARREAVAQRVVAMAAQQRPVLIGTGSVAESEALAQRLRALGLRPMVLNAVQSGLESEVIARAGRPGRITVSTQMAGRGTDIRLDPQVRDAGGLHVIACADTHAWRLWRQLVGRAGRQGDPGSFETLVCLEEGVLFHRLPRRLAATLVQRDTASRLTRALWRAAMSLDEWAQTLERRTLLRQDRAWAGRMAFSGSEE
ncbi:MAG: hypothetical protein RL456_172 [Pseudomonadota bacterium]|jgi:preprotein translocase subunit SecA